MRYLMIAALALALTACAHKPGLGSYADAGTTYAALSSGGFSEANPLLSWGATPAITALASIGLKHGMKHALEWTGTPPTMAHRGVETAGMGAAGWNLAALAGAATGWGIVAGFGAGLWYWVWGGG